MPFPGQTARKISWSAACIVGRRANQWRQSLCRLQHTVLVGRAAAGGNPANTFYSVKRLIGHSLAEVAADVDDLRYEVTDAANGSSYGRDDGGRHGADASGGSVIGGSRYDGGLHVADAPDGSVTGGGGGGGDLRLRCPARGTTLAPEEVSAALLRHLLAQAEVHLGSAVTNAVSACESRLSCPSLLQ